MLKGTDDTVVTKLVQIAQEYGRGKNAEELGKELGLSKSTVQQYANSLRSLGVDVKKMHRTGIYLRAVAVLKKECPKLCTKIKS
jgi:biotin operon repressor